MQKNIITVYLKALEYTKSVRYFVGANSAYFFEFDHKI